jgi:hypothetical protein
MPLPRKLKHLIELELKDVETPDYVWLTYAVCAVEKDACGWGGWMIEAAFKKTGTKHPTGTGDKVLSAVMDQVCPRCGKTTFRTAASLRLVPSEDQTPPETTNCECLPIEYED